MNAVYMAFAQALNSYKAALGWSAYIWQVFSSWQNVAKYHTISLP